MARTGQGFDYWPGTDRNLAYLVTDCAGASVDVSAACARWVLQDEYDSGSLVLYRTAGSGVTASGSVLTVVIRAEDTADLGPGLYHAELSASASDGTARVLAVGTVAVHPIA